MGRISSRVIIFDNNKVLLMFRRKVDSNGNINEYYVVPGGGVEENETLQQAVERELLEELNLRVKALNYVGLETTPQGFSNYFEAQIVGGTLQLGGEEKDKNNNENYYEPRFIELDKLDTLKVFGKEYILNAYNKIYSKITNATLTDQGICPTC